MTLNEYFDEIFCINLDSRGDRWYRCQELFEKHRLQVTRISAVDGHRMPNHNGLRPGEVGCTASHLIALSEIASRCKRGLVLEDDVEFVENIQYRFRDLLPDIPQEWDMLYFGGNHIEEPQPLTYRVAKITMTYSTVSYGISGDFARAMSEQIMSGRDIIDVAYADHHRYHRCYATWPSLTWQRPGMSDIQHGWMDYSFMKPAD